MAGWSCTSERNSSRGRNSVTVGCTAMTSAFALRRSTSATSPTVSPGGSVASTIGSPPSCATTATSPDATRCSPCASSPSLTSLSPFSKMRVSKRSTSVARSCGGTDTSTGEVRARLATMRRRQCAASSMPTSGRRPATCFERVARRDEQDRRPRRHDARRARRARQQRHLAEERAARPGARARPAARRPRRAARRDTSSSPRATMYASAPSSPSLDDDVPRAAR